MRLTNRNARVDSAGTHNDRNFNLDHADHIDQSAKHKNKYITYLGDDMPMTFEELEKEFYNQHFEEYLNIKNEKALACNHPSRVKTMDQYYRHKFTRPEDKILQIGDKGDHIDGDLLWSCALEYMEEFNNKYGDHCKILDMALHMDESTPHVHVRRVWVAEDENGIEFINQTKALTQMGIERPNLVEEEGRYNNSKITFTQEDNELFIDICRNRGIEIENPKFGRSHHFTVTEYKEEKDRIRNDYENDIKTLKEEAKQLEETVTNELDTYLQFIQQNVAFRMYYDEIENIKDKETEDKLTFLASFFEKEMVTMEMVSQGKMSMREFTEYQRMRTENSNLITYLKRKGYYNDYERFVEEEKRKQTR